MERKGRYIPHNYIRRIRRMLGLTIEASANLIGLQDPGRFSKWENSHSIPSVENLFRLSHLYGVLPHELLGPLWEEIGLEMEERRENLQSQSGENPVD